MSRSTHKTLTPGRLNYVMISRTALRGSCSVDGLLTTDASKLCRATDSNGMYCCFVAQCGGIGCLHSSSKFMPPPPPPPVNIWREKNTAFELHSPLTWVSGNACLQRIIISSKVSVWILTPLFPLQEFNSANIRTNCVCIYLSKCDWNMSDS